jgi:hypothetical protein
MRLIKITLLIAISAAFIQAGDRTTDPDPLSILGNSEAAKKANVRALTRAWERSLIPLVASQSLDAASSYGYRELNPLLASQNGTFGVKATAMKFSVVAGLIGVEYLLVRKSPKAARLFEKLNWSSSLLTTGLAVHNYVVR